MSHTMIVPNLRDGGKSNVLVEYEIVNSRRVKLGTILNEAGNEMDLTRTEFQNVSLFVQEMVVVSKHDERAERYAKRREALKAKKAAELVH